MLWLKQQKIKICRVKRNHSTHWITILCVVAEKWPSAGERHLGLMPSLRSYAVYTYIVKMNESPLIISNTCIIKPNLIALANYCIHLEEN